MARIRTVKPEFWTHEDLSALPEATHLLAAALLNYADDHGYFNANVGLVKAACSPLREPSVSIPESFRSLQAVGYLAFGVTPDGKRYGRIVKFADHQRVSHPSKSKIACLSITWEGSGNPPEPLGSPPESFRPEGNREQGKEGNREGNVTRAREPVGDAPRTTSTDTHQLRVELEAIYPPGTYRLAHWALVERELGFRLDEGATADELCQRTREYRAQQDAKKSTGTQYVLSPEKFYGRDGHWRGPHPVPQAAASVTPIRTATDIAEEFERRAAMAGGAK
jgi:hypothetical protein